MVMILMNMIMLTTLMKPYDDDDNSDDVDDNDDVDDENFDDNDANDVLHDADDYGAAILMVNILMIEIFKIRCLLFLSGHQ